MVEPTENPTRNEWIVIYAGIGIVAYAAIYYAYKYYSKNDPPDNPQPTSTPAAVSNPTQQSSFNSSGSENYGQCNCGMSTAPVAVEQQGYYVQSQAVCNKIMVNP